MNETIFVRVTEDKIQVKSFGGGVNYKGAGVEGGAKGQMEYFQTEPLKDGFVVIGARDYLAFPTGDVPYVSVITERRRLVCENYRPGGDISIIVTAEGTVKQTRYCKIWVDTDGNSHWRS